MSKQFVTITDKVDGQTYKIPDAFITAKIHGEYKDMPPFKAFGRAIADYIALEQAKAKEVTHV